VLAAIERPANYCTSFAPYPGILCLVAVMLVMIHRAPCLKAIFRLRHCPIPDGGRKCINACHFTCRRHSRHLKDLCSRSESSGALPLAVVLLCSPAMSSSSSSSSSSTKFPVATPEESLRPPRPFFLESSGAPDHEGTPAGSRPPSQPRGSTSGHLRPQDRQGSSISSIISSGAATPANPFSTPVMEATNALSAPPSVISFSLGDAAATGFGDAHRRISAHSSVENSAVDLQQRQSATPREAFSSPRPRPVTVMYPSGGNGMRSRLAKRKRPASTMLSGELSKPWVGKKDKAARISYILTYSMVLLGIIAAAVRCFYGWRSVSLIGKLCPVLDDEFNGNDLDGDVWVREVDLGGYGWVTFPYVSFCCVTDEDGAGTVNSR
jgi:hypothetical protein